jgi:hypothetical protein
MDKAVQSETGERMLLARRKAEPLERTAGEPEKTYALGSWIDVPAESAFPLRMKVRVPSGGLASLLRLLYKPPEYGIDYVLSDGQAASRKFMARMAEDGFLLAPFIDSNAEFLAALERTEYGRYREGKSKDLKRIVRFRITCARLGIACASDIGVSFEAVRDLELGRLPGAKALQ